MDKKNKILIIGVGVGAFIAGFLLRLVTAGSPTPEEMPKEEVLSSVTAAQTDNRLSDHMIDIENLQFRVDDGNMQWFDGVRWNTVGSVEELVAQDKFEIARQDLEQFEEEYLTAMAQEEAATEGVSFDREENQVLTGKTGKAVKTQKETTPEKNPEPSTKPASTKPTATKPDDTANATPGNTAGGNSGSSDNGGGDSGSSDNGGGDSGSSDNGGGDSGSSDNGGGDSGSSDNGGGDSGSSDNGGGDNGGGGSSTDNTGDGEDMDGNWSEWFE